MSIVAQSASSPAAVGDFSAEAFSAHLQRQKSLPAWWLDLQREAYAEFAALPMPGDTDEAWRFSSYRSIHLHGTEATASAGVSAPSDVFAESLTSAARLVFSNNQLVHRTALTPALAGQGVVVSTLREAIVAHPELLRKHFMAQPQKLGSAKFAALHTAFVSDGAFIHVPKGVEVTAPVLITHAVLGLDATIFPHTLVIAEENAKITVVDHFVSQDATPDVRQLAIGANDLYAAHGAAVTYVGAQQWSRETLSIQSNSTVVRRDARVQSLNLHLGGKQARHESLSQLQAPGAFSEMLALTVAEGSQEFDQRTLQIHQAPNTKSDLLYKNALLDSARTIFSGLIIVDPDAQKTDAYQSNRNLMLSDNAEANALPGLEIQANDVRCTHGATTSRIEPEQEFYLKSRGIHPQQAHELLVFGFFEEVLNRLQDDSLHTALRTLLQAKLSK